MGTSLPPGGGGGGAADSEILPTAVQLNDCDWGASITVQVGVRER